MKEESVKAKEYQILNQTRREIDRDHKRNVFHYLRDQQDWFYSRWTPEQVFLGLFLIMWSMLTVCEFVIGVTNKNEALLAESFHSFFHTFSAVLSLIALCYNTQEGAKDYKYPYGLKKLNILAAFVNGLNGIFSTFFVLVKQSHEIFAHSHNGPEKGSHNLEATSITSFYTHYAYVIKAIACFALLFCLRKYVIYVTYKQRKSIEPKGK